jgi:hypothetical protein
MNPKIFNVRDDWTLFRSLTTLTQKAGVSVDKIAMAVVKELVDNALDTGAKCDIGLIGNDGFYVEDDGLGIEGDGYKIAHLFSIRRPLTSTKFVRLPNRGALGNGLRVVAGAVLSIKDATLTVSTKERTLKLLPQHNDGTTKFEIIGDYEKKGTRVEVILPGYVNEKTLFWGSEAISLRQGTYYNGKTSPHWYDSEAFYELLKSNPEKRMVRDFIGDFDGCSGKKSGIITKDFSKQKASSLTIEDADTLLGIARKHSKQVKPSRLGQIGFIKGDGEYAKLESYFTIKSHRGGIDAELPVVVEAWVNKAQKTEISFFVNRTPITSDIGMYHSKSEIMILESGFSGHHVKAANEPIRINVNVITPFMPIISDSKKPDISYIAEPISEAIQKAINKLKKITARNLSYPNTKGKTQKRVILDNLDKAIAQASGNGKYRYSQRQLFYTVRPYVLEDTKKELKYENFCSVITDYEANIGEDLPGIYRDSRGTLYHPHSGDIIPLGTLDVEKYKRPKWTFNKILYSEKEGFFEILKDEKWAEKNDCALLTSKGYASRAARDVIDLLAETEEELLFFCIHDADAAGTMIFQSLNKATKARPERRVKVVNLGLEPKEGLKMGLQVENITGKKKEMPVAEYVTNKWKKWLQTKRIELNAMDTPQFIKWLNDTMGKHGNEKVVPTKDVLTSELLQHGRKELNKAVIEQLLKEMRAEERVEAEYKQLLPILQSNFINIDEKIREELLVYPIELWSEPLKRLAKKIVDSYLKG